MKDKWCKVKYSEIKLTLGILTYPHRQSNSQEQASKIDEHEIGDVRVSG